MKEDIELMKALTPVEMMNFVLNMMNFVSNMMDFAINTMDLTSKGRAGQRD